MRVVFPVKHYKDEGFVERKIEINEEDLPAIIEEYLLAHGDFKFDEIEFGLRLKCKNIVLGREPLRLNGERRVDANRPSGH